MVFDSTDIGLAASPVKVVGFSAVGDEGSPVGLFDISADGVEDAMMVVCKKSKTLFKCFEFGFNVVRIIDGGGVVHVKFVEVSDDNRVVVDRAIAAEVGDLVTSAKVSYCRQEVIALRGFDIAGLKGFLVRVGVVELVAEDVELADEVFDFGDDLSGELGGFGRRGLVGLLRARGFAEDGCETHD